MKGVGRYIAIASASLAAIPAAGAIGAPCATAPTAEFARGANLNYPDFCSIPPVPSDVRPVAAFKAAVVRTRLAGAVVVRQSGAETFSLAGTEAFAEGAKRQATPPSAMTKAETAGTEAFAAAARAKAAPPKRHRRH
jgi:hypothetical protein